jgi:hypothetical protein
MTMSTTFDPTETVDKLRMALYAIERGDSATAELRTRQALELIASHEKGMAVTVQYAARQS